MLPSHSGPEVVMSDSNLVVLMSTKVNPQTSFFRTQSLCRRLQNSLGHSETIIHHSFKALSPSTSFEIADSPRLSGMQARSEPDGRGRVPGEGPDASPLHSSPSSDLWNRRSIRLANIKTWHLVDGWFDSQSSNSSTATFFAKKLNNFDNIIFKYRLGQVHNLRLKLESRKDLYSNKAAAISMNEVPWTFVHEIWTNGRMRDEIWTSVDGWTNEFRRTQWERPRAQQPEQQERQGKRFLRIVRSIVRILCAGAERSTWGSK